MSGFGQVCAQPRRSRALYCSSARRLATKVGISGAPDPMRTSALENTHLKSMYGHHTVRSIACAIKIRLSRYELPKNGDLPKLPLITIGSRVPSVATILRQAYSPRNTNPEIS
jgi:hypothetical protein